MQRVRTGSEKSDENNSGKCKKFGKMENFAKCGALKEGKH